MLLIFLFFIWRFFDFIIAYLAPKFIPYLGFFPYKEQLSLYHLPNFLSSFANFDGIHYLLIAKNGYAQHQQAFFPLYPLFIRFLSPLFAGNYLIAGLFISNLSFTLGLFLLIKYLSSIRYQKSNILFLVLFLLTFPTSFYFGAIYTEGLFFFLVISCLYFVKKERHLFAGMFAFLASLTRLMGIFLIIPIALQIIKNKKLKAQSYLFLFPLVGLCLYCLYLWRTTGDPLFFFHSQPTFGANRSTQPILLPQVYYRYLKIFFTAHRNFQYWISVFEFLIFNLVFFVLILDLFRYLKLKIFLKFKFLISNFDRIGLALFSLCNLLLPTLTGTFSSIPRYSLLSISFFLFLSEIKSRSIKITIALIFIILHILMLGFFIQGYFVS